MIDRAEALDVAGVRVVTRADLLALTLRAACDPARRRSRALRDLVDIVLQRGDFPWGPHALRRARADAAALVSVPSWYPYWEGLPTGQKPTRESHGLGSQMSSLSYVAPSGANNK